jgi:hypothetical protein
VRRANRLGPIASSAHRRPRTRGDGFAYFFDALRAEGIKAVNLPVEVVKFALAMKRWFPENTGCAKVTTPDSGIVLRIAPVDALRR